MNPPRVVLASTSRYRAELLHRLLDDFQQMAPAVAETTLPAEAPAARSMRLATAKAAAVSRLVPAAWVIGSDQVAARGTELLHKPGTIENARQQLLASSGKNVDFYTSVCVIAGSGAPQTWLDHTRVTFRQLTGAEIERYLAREHPLDCAGSCKSEGAGIALFEGLETTDPSALIGLPLIGLAKLLRASGLRIP